MAMQMSTLILKRIAFPTLEPQVLFECFAFDECANLRSNDLNVSRCRLPVAARHG